MSFCSECNIEYKIEYCCSKYPLNGKSKKMKINNKFYRTCIYLNKKGECSVYETRPRICRDYECGKIILGIEKRISLKEQERRMTKH